MASVVCPRCSASVQLDNNGTMKDHFPKHVPDYYSDGTPKLCPGSGNYP